MPDLVLCHGTVATASFSERVAAAAEAGYVGIGLFIPEYLRLLDQGWTDREMQAVLNAHGVAIREVEVLFGFDADPGPANIPSRPGLVYGDPDVERTALHVADTFGPRTILTVGAFTAGPPHALAVERFGELCDRAARHDVRVALEFVPYSDIPDLATARRIVAGAGRANGGLCVDSWHFFRGSPSFVDLADPGPVFLVQLNDGPAVPTDPDRMTDAVRNRRVPGTGDFDLATFLATLARAGVDVPISVEVFSTELAALPAAQAAGRAADGARRVIAAAMFQPGQEH